MTILDEIRTVSVVFIMLLLPGWALLSIGQYWKRWEPLQRWFLALSLGIAVYPVLYYVTRAIAPDIRIGTRKLLFLLVASLIIIIWNFRHTWREQFRFDKLSWLVLLVLIVTLSTRFVIAHQHPFLAGDDSLHHTLLTELTATYGRLPYTLEPYDNTLLDHYHLGLYALTAPLKLLVRLRSDQALLWMCQVLNGISGIGSFLFLDKFVSRKSAIAGLAFVGLFCVFPNYYVNWGRFTQLAGQVILFPTAVMYWEHIKSLSKKEVLSKGRKPDLQAIIYIAICTGSVCLLHFRVAAFLFPLLLIIFFIELSSLQNLKEHRWNVFFPSVLIVLLVIVIILPALIPGVESYWNARVSQNESGLLISSGRMSDSSYYSKGDTKTMQLSADSTWLYLICVIGIIVGLVRSESKQISILIISWSLFFAAYTYAYLTNIPLLAIMNRTAVVLALYIPMSIGMGLLVLVLERLMPEKEKYAWLPVGLIILANLLSVNSRIKDYWPEQAFMTTADLKAMQWIRINTPQDAVFGTNTGFLSSIQPFGTDAGYWIPYYAERDATTLTLLSSLTDTQESEDVKRANAVYELYNLPSAVSNLCLYDIDYLYSGAKPALGQNEFNIDDILNQPGTRLVYDQDGVQIVKICER